MRIGARLIIGFTIMAAAVAFVGYSSFHTIRQIQQRVQTVSNDAIATIVTANDMTVSIQSAHSSAQDLLDVFRAGGANQPANQAEVARGAAALEDALHEFSEDASHLVAMSDAASRADVGSRNSDARRAILAKLSAKFDAYRQSFHAILQQAKTNTTAGGMSRELQLDSALRNEIVSLLDKYSHVPENVLADEVRSIENAVADAQRLNWVTTLAALAIGLVIVLFLSNSISKPLARLTEHVQRLGGGDWATPVGIESSDEIGVLAGAFNQMVLDLKSTTVSKLYVDNIINSMREYLLVLDLAGKVKTVNRATLGELGYAESELIGHDFRQLIVEHDDVTAPKSPAPNLWNNRELSLRCKTGAEIPVYCSTSELCDASGEQSGLVCVALDVSEIRKVEADLRRSLEEKELLLKEVHHRVKNNLQIISSMLNLQARADADPDSVRLIRESQQRVQSMALIHEQLYQSPDLARINFSEYLERLVLGLQRTHAATEQSITITTDVAPVGLSIDEAIPCGMLVNELVSNAMEHAFPGGRQGQVHVRFRPATQEGYELEVSDNGVGLKQLPDPRKLDSLGLKLVDALVKQLGGKLELSCENGSRMTVRFPGRR